MHKEQDMNLEGEMWSSHLRSKPMQYAQDNAQTGKICQLTLRFRCYAQIPCIIKTAEKTFQDFLESTCANFQGLSGPVFFFQIQQLSTIFQNPWTPY